MSGTIWDPTIPDTDVVNSIANKPGGVGIYHSSAAGIAYLKSLLAGSNVTITDNGNGTITIASSGGGGGSGSRALKRNIGLVDIATASGVYAQAIGFTANANTLLAGTIIEFKVWGNVHLANSLWPAGEIRVNPATLGANIHATISALGGFVTGTAVFQVEGHLRILTIGAGGTAIGTIVATLAGQPSGGNSASSVSAAQPINTTVSNVVELLLSTTNISNIFHILGGYIEQIDP